MDLTPETRLGLHPQLNLKNDVDRAVLITRSQPLANRSYICRRIHPTEAIILALMDGSRTLGQAGEVWAELTRKSPDAGLADVFKVTGFFTSGERHREEILLEVDESNRSSFHKYSPADFVIPRDRVNLVDRRLRIPYNVYFLPSMFCPQKCIYCYAKTCPMPEDNLLSLGRLREIFTELRSLGVEAIQLSGGDPLARKDIIEILEMIFEIGMTVDLPTKTGLSYERILRLKELGVKLLQVSLDSSEPEVLDHMVGVKSYHRRAFRILEDMKRAEMKVRVNCVLTPFNLPTVGSLIDFVGRLGNVVRLSLSPYGRSLFCHRDELFVEESDLDRVEEEIAARADLYPHMQMSVGAAAVPAAEDPEKARLNWERRSFCTANRDGFVILPDGRVTVCEELYDHPDFIIGDLRVQSVMEMWSSPKALSLIRPDQSMVPEGPCKTCSGFTECNSVRGRCWRDVLKSYGWNKPHYPDPRCPQAPPGHRLG